MFGVTKEESNPPPGTAKDLDNVEKTFKSFNYAVADFRDCSPHELVGVSAAAANYDYPESIRSIIIYFAGHGGYNVQNQRAFIMPGESFESRVDVYEDIVKGFEPEYSGHEMKNKYRIFLFDCCLNDPYTDTTATVTKVEKDIPSYLPPRSNCLVAFGTSVKYTSAGDKKGGGYWTSALLENIREYDLPITDILEKTHEDVYQKLYELKSKGEKVEIIQGPHYSSTLGPFYFGML